MRIAIFSDTFFPQANGVVTVIWQSALALGELGHEVCIVSISNEISRVSLERKLNDRIKIINLPSLPFFGYKGERFTFPLGWSIRQIKRFKPDIIHSHTSFGVGWEAIFCAKILKIPLVGTHHTFFDHYLKHINLDFEIVKKLSWKFFIAYFKYCDLLLSPSQALKDEFKKKGMNKPIEVIFNPTDIDFFIPPENEEYKKSLKQKYGIVDKSIIYMGRLSYEKSIDQVISAFAIVNKKKPQVKLMILGDGPEKTILEKLSAQLDLQHSVEFIGRYNHDQALIDLLNANDIFVTASKSENLPVSLLEAMACGLPIVAVDERGIPEVVKNKLNGYIVQADQPALLAKKIIELLEDKDIDKFANASRELAKRYSSSTYAKNLEKHYAILINKYNKQ
ncbi:MAG: hypothetical protein UT48_C0010G0080 [Parcubacteria group bacterium GW2011_GWE2_39_37]|uniref:Glycosyl transferase group 1 n=1 Tax=Candidatus Falkowbacteria bacterium GW2011_GWF2_39_8 TaxID=1618642 RepID=A0A0G0Q290_9BACT|nr:MAG: hypothetical protein UT48_C0010G0080 [Parcubacteria group bacterium GW2011_GWE2_39_37]KKR31481.1 MAG: hypothetical protein UT64_C0059G0004 [Candidatus Falkowbacteria bacterium GW2011_GWF2_39_8]